MGPRSMEWGVVGQIGGKLMREDLEVRHVLGSGLDGLGAWSLGQVKVGP